MDWIIILQLITEAPNYTQSQSHYIAPFGSEKLCTDAAAAMRTEFARTTEQGAKTTVRALCQQRK